MKRCTYYILSVLMLFVSCTDDYEFTSERCYLVFDNTSGRSTYLTQCMNSLSPGVFCRIWVSGNYFVFQTNQSSSTEEVSMTAVDMQRTIILGTYNGTGIIVGYGNLDSPATFYAYDTQCPNCYASTGLPRYSLTMNSNGTASCSKCSRVYDMNNRGIVISGDAGSKLMRYHANTTGALGVLSVINNY